MTPSEIEPEIRELFERFKCDPEPSDDPVYETLMRRAEANVDSEEIVAETLTIIGMRYGYKEGYIIGAKSKDAEIQRLRDGIEALQKAAIECHSSDSTRSIKDAPTRALVMSILELFGGHLHALLAPEPAKERES